MSQRNNAEINEYSAEKYAIKQNNEIIIEIYENIWLNCTQN